MLWYTEFHHPSRFGLSLRAMQRASLDSLTAAQLTPSERQTIERFAARLGNELGSDLRALWLYGSRARGTAHPESDVDLLVIADGGRDRYGRIAFDLSEEAAIAEGESPFTYSVHVHDIEWLRGRRAIDSFFIQEVDRDKIVLVGGALA
jgi:predicted nucleotidyltransferase